jgi:leucyl aminopeptidase
MKMSSPARLGQTGAMSISCRDLLTPFDIEITVGRSVARTPAASSAVGYGVGPTSAVPRALGLGRAALKRLGFSGAAGQTMVLPQASGPTVVAIGVGDRPDPTSLRNAAASFVRSVPKAAHLSIDLADIAGVAAANAAAAVVEGVALASYRYVGLKNDRSSASPLASIHLVVGEARERGARTGSRRGAVTARAARLARDLANTPPAHLNARDLADLAVELAGVSDLDVEVFDRDDLIAMGCGGMIAVNKASVEPPRLVKLTYLPGGRRAQDAPHLALVGKGVMYDSGGLSLKPSDGFHQVMKMDMSGAAAVLATMTTLADLRCANRVTGYLVCTDNMPSGSAMKLGDVLTMRNGTTVEVLNTDAEGRLILADGLSLATEEEPDAVIDIATLTGAAMAALGTDFAAVLGTDQALIDRVADAAQAADEPVWQLPLAAERYRRLLESNVADLKNIGGPYAGAITASIFLSSFVGSVPWAHLDIAGPMKVDSDDRWMSRGATGFGTRLLVDLVTAYRR